VKGGGARRGGAATPLFPLLAAGGLAGKKMLLLLLLLMMKHCATLFPVAIIRGVHKQPTFFFNSFLFLSPRFHVRLFQLQP
jgi:hypothetical protein